MHCRRDKLGQLYTDDGLASIVQTHKSRNFANFKHHGFKPSDLSAADSQLYDSIGADAGVSHALPA